MEREGLISHKNMREEWHLCNMKISNVSCITLRKKCGSNIFVELMWFMYVSIDVVWCPHPLQVHAQWHVPGREWYASALAMAGMQERYWYPAAHHMCPVRLMYL